MTYTLPELPYAKDALAPHINEQTLEFHYGKHHQAYLNNLNKLIEGSELAGLPLEDLIRQTAGDASRMGVFNNAAQVWNHTFYWNSMKPSGGGLPSGELSQQIDEDFESFEKFKDEFSTAAATQFGSGWAWLVWDKGVLKITKTSNADSPLTHSQVPLLCIDVWEHAYYLDFQNRRPDYIKTFLDSLVNWSFAAENFDNAKKNERAA